MTARARVVGPYALTRRLPMHHPLASIEFWEATRSSSRGDSASLLVVPREGSERTAAFDDWTAAFEADVSAAARLQEGASLRLRQHGRAGVVPFAEFEPFSGVSLREAWRERGAGHGWPPLVAVLIVERLADAVHHLYLSAHEHGQPNAVVHLNEGLVLCGADGDVHLLPRFSNVFDLEMPSFVEFPRILGLPPADERPTVRGLVFWLGSALYHLAVGKLPIGPDAWVDVQRLTTRFPRPSEADPRLASLDAVVAAATHERPSQRYADPGKLAAALGEVLLMRGEETTYRDAPWTAARAHDYLAERVALALQRHAG
jgi:hypothetical protein